MAARLSGKPAPKKKGKEESGEQQEEEAQQQIKKKKDTSHYPILILIALFSLISALAATAAVVYFVTGAAGNSGKTVDGHQEEKHEFHMGPTLDMGEFTLNLGNVNQRRFLRFAMTLHLETTHEAAKGGDEAKHKAFEEKLKEEMKPKEPLFKDIVVRTLSAKTAEELGTPRGKDEAKGELIAKLNEYMSAETHVKDIYFTEFIIQ